MMNSNQNVAGSVAKNQTKTVSALNAGAASTVAVVENNKLFKYLLILAE